MDLSYKATFPTNSGTLQWNEEFHSSRALHLVYLFSVTSFAAVGFLALARHILSLYYDKELDFSCPEYHVQNGDMGPGLIEGFAKVRN